MVQFNAPKGLKLVQPKLDNPSPTTQVSGKLKNSACASYAMIFIQAFLYLSLLLLIRLFYQLLVFSFVFYLRNH